MQQYFAFGIEFSPVETAALVVAFGLLALLPILAMLRLETRPLYKVVSVATYVAAIVLVVVYVRATSY